MQYATKMVCLSLILLLTCTNVGICQETGAAGKKIKVIKEVQGEVRGKGFNMIAITYNRDPVKGTEEEILLPYDEALQLVHKKSIKEINVGDTVVINFDETIETVNEKQTVSRKAVKLRFVKSAPAASAQTAEPATSEPIK